MVITGRDQLGLIPFYHGTKTNSISFASEFKAFENDCDSFELFPAGHYQVLKFHRKDRI